MDEVVAECSLIFGASEREEARKTITLETGKNALIKSRKPDLKKCMASQLLCKKYRQEPPIVNSL